jgi:hypothetical protein
MMGGTVKQDNVQYFAHIIIGPKRKALDLVEKKSKNRTSI